MDNSLSIAGMVTQSGKTNGSIRLKTIALPTEHGGWGLVLEPLLLGVLLAPTVPGLLLSIATLAAFLTRHPLKIAAGDIRRSRRSSRTRIAGLFAFGYATIALLAFVTVLNVSSRAFVLPLLLAIPFALVQIIYDVTGRSRQLLPELSGATAMAAVAASMMLLGGWPLSAALSLWAVLVGVRVVPSIIYVRTRLQMNHSARNSQLKTPSPVLAISTHLFSCTLVIVLAIAGLAPVLSLAPALLLTLRALYFLSPISPRLTARQVGFSEIALGLVTVALVVISYRVW